MSGGQVKIPIVVHLPTGASGRGAQHANSIEGFFFHVPGLFLVTPATPYDAKGLMISAIRNDNPVLFAVHKHTYGSAGRHLAESSVATGHVPEEPYAIALGVADVKREGSDVTIVSNLQMLHRSLNAAEALAQEGISVEVVDLRTLVPLDRDTIIRSVRKTSRLVIVEEDNLRGGWGAEVAAVVADQALLDLDAPIKRIAAADVPVPFSPPLEEFVIPNEARIVDTVRQLLGR
jgi:pyruvate/2-oxoglutarate/acetoin dehydrogenase E1 component